MTPQQHFLHRRALTATAWFCRSCGEPPRHASGLCDRCAIAERDLADGTGVRRRSTATNGAP